MDSPTPPVPGFARLRLLRLLGAGLRRTVAPRVTRRRLLRLVVAAVLIAVVAEASRVFFLSNHHTVLQGKLYRSAQLSPEELARVIAEKKIRTLINLRGLSPDRTWYLSEAQVTHDARVSQEDISLSAKRLPAPNEIRRLVDVLDHTEYPILVHCQQGADRTGLVSTAALLLHTDATLATARRQLWPRYGHMSVGRTAEIDRFFDFYEDWLAGRTHTPALFREWAKNEYCPGPYRARLSIVGPTPHEAPVGKGFDFTVHAENTSIEPWSFRPGGAGGVQLRYYLYSTGGEKLHTGYAGRLATTVAPGESIDLKIGFPPLTTPGRYLVHADLLDTQPIELLDADFVQYGSEPLVFHVMVK